MTTEAITAPQRVALTHSRDGVSLHVVKSADNPIARGDAIAAAFAAWGHEALCTDTYAVLGSADFGNTPVVNIPPGQYIGTAARPRWTTRTQIDEIHGVKPYGTTGFLLPLDIVSFHGMVFCGECSDPNEDAGIFSWNAVGNGSVSFSSCELDASKSCDWGALYNWTGGSKRASFLNCIIRHCRFGISMADGGGDTQWLAVDQSTFVGDANGSHTYGESSGIDPENGGALAGVLIRGGAATVRDTSFALAGLTEQYDPRVAAGALPKYGCSRMAAVTDRFYSESQKNIDIRIERIRTTLRPTAATPVARDLDIHYRQPVVIYDEQAIAFARGGSNPADGTLVQWPDTVPPK